MVSLVGFEKTFLITLFALILIGLVSLFSTTHYDPAYFDFFGKQLVWAGLGLILAVVISYIDYSFWSRYSWLFYLTSIVILLITLGMGKPIRGATSWLSTGFFNIQTSEIARVALIILFAHLLAQRKKTEQTGTYERAVVYRFFLFSLLAAIPILLIIIQPDLGTAATFVPLYLLALFFGGLPLPLLFFFIVIFGSTTFITLQLLLAHWAPAENNYAVLISRIITDQEVAGQIILGLAFFFCAFIYLMHALSAPQKKQRILMTSRSFLSWTGWAGILFIIILVLSIVTSVFLLEHLKEYQQKRLISFIHPASYPLQGGYNIIQAKIAIGSGGIWGKGFRAGTQHSLGFLPEAHTDFIFSIWAEEWGVIGVTALIALWLLLVLRSWHIATLARDRFGFYLVIIWSGAIIIQALINIAVNLGLLPIIGIPLPLISYGGSSLFCNLFGAGLVLAVWRQHNVFGTGEL